MEGKPTRQSKAHPPKHFVFPWELKMLLLNWNSFEKPPSLNEFGQTYNEHLIRNTPPPSNTYTCNTQHTDYSHTSINFPFSQRVSLLVKSENQKYKWHYSFVLYGYSVNEGQEDLHDEN